MSELCGALNSILRSSLLVNYTYVQRICGHCYHHDDQWEEVGWKADEKRYNAAAMSDLFQYAVYLFGPDVRNNTPIKTELLAAYYQLRGKESEYYVGKCISVEIVETCDYCSPLVWNYVVCDVYMNQSDLDRLEERPYGYYNKFLKEIGKINKVCLEYATDREEVIKRIDSFKYKCEDTSRKAIADTLPRVSADEEKRNEYIAREKARIEKETALKIQENSVIIKKLRSQIGADTIATCTKGLSGFYSPEKEGNTKKSKGACYYSLSVIKVILALAVWVGAFFFSLGMLLTNEGYISNDIVNWVFEYGEEKSWFQFLIIYGSCILPTLFASLVIGPLFSWSSYSRPTWFIGALSAIGQLATMTCVTLSMQSKIVSSNIYGFIILVAVPVLIIDGIALKIGYDWYLE